MFITEKRESQLKRRIVRKNKGLLTAKFKGFVLTEHYSVSVDAKVSYLSICASKLRGQLSYMRRLARQRKMNARQLKKYRKKQIAAGLIGSKYGGMCKSRLQPAGFKNHVSTDLNSHNL